MYLEVFLLLLAATTCRVDGFFFRRPNNRIPVLRTPPNTPAPVLSVEFQSTVMPGYPNQHAIPSYVNKELIVVKEHLVHGASRLLRGCEGRFQRVPCNRTHVTRERCEAWKCCWKPNDPVPCAESRYIIYQLDNDDELEKCGTRPADAPPPATQSFNAFGLLLAASSGRPASSYRILGGGTAKQGDWPWMAILKLAGIYKCGGSMIHPKFVLTAAHCFMGSSNFPVNLITVVLGELDRTVVSRFEREIKVAGYKIHPDYDTQLNNDVAVVELKLPEGYRRASTICLPPPGFDTEGYFSNGPKCIAIGWGETLSGSLSNVLREVSLPIFSKSACQSSLVFPPVHPWEPKICAGGVANMDTCRGDSGGPLMCQHADQRWFVHGIVSYGSIPCGMANLPAVYAKVSHPTIANWILEQIE